MNLRHRVGPGIRSLESFREAMGVLRPASVSDMLSRGIALRFVGFHCFGETDEFSPHDEPYFTFGVLPSVIEGKQTVQTLPPYEDPDAGDSVADVVELYRGLPLGAVVSVTLATRSRAHPLLVEGAARAHWRCVERPNKSRKKSRLLDKPLHKSAHTLFLFLDYERMTRQHTGGQTT